MSDIYHPGNRELQDAFGTRPLADRVNELIIQPEIGDEEREFITSRNMFFISSVDPDGQPTVSYKGGEVGFVRVLDSKTIAFPLYDGNGMFLSAGNIKASPNVGLLFIDFENPHRLRLHGKATVSVDDELMDSYHEAQMIVRIAVSNTFINCPRYIHPATPEEPSIYVPVEGRETPDPEWKSWEVVADVLPDKKP
ncbi:MAG: pyridoxamine 5'-phosphate oxidase family protein [Gammaproteobacteria bacterium]|nr:pyridoxamine 5'-phosphate oxidase family protein [Gammaproteobacteria bacterium]MBQ0840569.1 pyridoxamine 5'-phosphate oxidase family protein [Gammaproteobacteria bacterium]